MTRRLRNRKQRVLYTDRSRSRSSSDSSYNPSNVSENSLTSVPVNANAEYGGKSVENVDQCLSESESLPDLVSKEQQEKKGTTENNNEQLVESVPENGSDLDEDDDHFRGKRGDTIRRRYSLIKKLGRGFFATVWMAKDNRTNTYAAIKFEKNHPNCKSQTLDEIEYMRKVTGHPHTLQLIETVFVRGTLRTHTGIVTELLGPNLQTILEANEKFHLKVVKKICSQVLNGLQYIHDICDFVHADLKMDNILVTVTQQDAAIMANSKKENLVNVLGIDFSNPDSRVEVKIADFGLSIPRNEFIGKDLIQACGYRAPEVFFATSVDTPIDIWAVGCITYEMVIGEIMFGCSEFIDDHIRGHQTNISNRLGVIKLDPFKGKLKRGSKKLFVNGVFQPVIEQNMPSLAMRAINEGINPIEAKMFGGFIGSLMKCDPGERPAARDALSHEFLRQR